MKHKIFPINPINYIRISVDSQVLSGQRGPELRHGEGCVRKYVVEAYDIARGEEVLHTAIETAIGVRVIDGEEDTAGGGEMGG